MRCGRNSDNLGDSRPALDCAGHQEASILLAEMQGQGKSYMGVDERRKLQRDDASS